MKFKDYITEEVEQLDEAAATWKDCENAAEFFWYFVQENGRKEKEITDVKRNGSNGVKVKFKNGAVASIVLDPQNKF